MGRNVNNPLRESNLKLRLALRAAQIGTWDWDIESGEMDYSPRARAIFGFSPDEPITFDKARAVTHPDDLPRTSAQAKRALDPATKARDPYEYRIIRPETGEVRWVLAYGEAMFARNGEDQRPYRYLGTIQDITERKQVEEALRRSELRQRLAMEAARMAVWELDIATDAATLTPELCRMFGFDPSENPTLDQLRDRYFPGERERIQQAAGEALAKGETQFESEFRIRLRDGNLRWLLMRAEVLFSPSGQPERVIGVILDIDARKRQDEQKLLFMRELNHRVKNSLSVVQSIANQTFRQDRADPEALQTFRQRLYALARANDALVEQEWAAFSLRALIERLLEPYRDPPERVALSGPDISLPPRLNVPLALVLHELATNAAKYGSLAARSGTVEIAWQQGDGGVELTWTERGGMAVESPLRKSFGMRLISEILPIELGAVEIEARLDGVYCRIMLAL